MFRRISLVTLLVELLPPACSGGSGAALSDGGVPEGSVSEGGTPETVPEPEPLGATFTKSPCVTREESNAPGISIHFTTTKCSYTSAEARAGIVIEYALVIEHALPDVYSQQIGRQPLGQHEQLNEGPGPGATHYWLFPAPAIAQGAPIPKPGIYRRTVRWDGMTFAGPNGTLADPKLGKYELMVGSYFYPRPTKGMEEMPLYSLGGVFNFEITE